MHDFVFGYLLIFPSLLTNATMSNGKRTERSPIRSVIIPVITK